MKKKLISLFMVVVVTVVSLPVFTAYADSAAATDGFSIDGDTTTTPALLLLNLDLNTVVYAKNPDQKMYPASTTKIMTYIVVSEYMKEHNLDPDQEQVTIEQKIITELSGTGSSMANLQAGDVFTVTQLLHAMLIPSGNEAANIVANALGPGIPAFVEKMNAKAQELGMKNTHYVNPHGMFDEQQYTTAEDIAILAQYAMKIDTFREAVSQIRYTLPATDYADERLLVTTNMMMEPGTVYYRDYITGIKTGSLPEAGKCVVSTASQDGYNYLCVILGAPTEDANGESYDYNMAFYDTVHLYDWAFENFANLTMLDPDTPINEAKVKYGKDQDFVHVAPQEKFTALLPSYVTEDDVQKIIHLPEEPLAAPIQAGDVVGSVELKLKDETIGEVSLVAKETVERSKWLYYTDMFQQALGSIWAKIILIIIVLLIAIYIIYAVLVNQKNKKYKKIRRRKKL